MKKTFGGIVTLQKMINLGDTRTKPRERKDFVIGTNEMGKILTYKPAKKEMK
jgi:hypothetical protein